MFCLYCGSQLPDDAVFCGQCGRKQSRLTSSPVLPVPISPATPVSSGQFPSGNVPMVQGTPQVSSIPMVPGSPSTFRPTLAEQSIPPHAPAVSAPSWNPPHTGAPPITPYPPHYEPQSPHQKDSGAMRIGRHLSRRAVVAGLVGGGAVVAAGGLGLVLSHSRQNPPFSTSTPVPTPTPVPIGTVLLIYRGVSGGASAVAWAPDGKNIAAASNIIYIWDATTGNTLLTYRGHSSYLGSVKWSHNSSFIASGGGDVNSSNSDFSIQVCDAASGNLITSFTNHRNAIEGIAWSPNDQQIASCAFGDYVYVWDATSGNINLTYNSNPGVVLCIAWSPDGQRIATGDGQGYIKIWDAASGNVLQTYLGHTSQVNGVAWSPDGTYIASVSGGNLTDRSPSGAPDSSLQVWDPNTGNRIFRVVSGAWSVAWSPDGKRLLITSKGHQIYDAASGNLLFTFSAQSPATDWSPDGTRVVSESDDKTVVIWKAV